MDKMSVPDTGHFIAFLQCAFQALLSTDVNMQESHQKLKEEPGVLEDRFSHHPGADHHLQGELLVEVLNDTHTHKKPQSHMTGCEGQSFNIPTPLFFL